MNELSVIAISLLVGALVVAVGVYGLPILRKKQGYWHEDEIERALLPIIYQAICSAFKLSEASVNAGNGLLDGVDKAKVANVLYDLLPAMIGPIPIGIIKGWVSRERFANMVEGVYLDFDKNFHVWICDMDKSFVAWQKDNQPS